MSAPVRTEIIGSWYTSQFGNELSVTYDTGSPFGVYHIDSATLDQSPGGLTYILCTRGTNKLYNGLGFG